MSTYPKFDHNAKKVAAWNDESLLAGETGYLTYSVNERGAGHYSLSRTPSEREVRANNSVNTPDTAAVVLPSPASAAWVWVERQ